MGSDTKSSGSHHQIQVLQVEDDPSIADLTATFLEREDDRLSVETAVSATEGLEKIADRPRHPDCVVSDFDMPGMDGIELLQSVRENHPELPFILFTGKGSEEVASEAISAGVTDYLQKQTGTEQYELLCNRIRNAVRTQHQKQRADRTDELMRLTELTGDTGGFEIHVDTGEVLMTDGYRRLAGYTDDATISLEEAIEQYHPDDQPAVRQTISQAAETDESTRGTWRLQSLDGTERLVDVTITPATNTSINTGNSETESDTTVTTLRGAIDDVTDIRQRERQLTELKKVSKDLLTAETRQEVAEIGVEAARDVLDFQANGLHLSEAESTQLMPVAKTDELVSLLGSVPALSVNDSIAGRTYQSGDPTIIEDARSHPDVHNSDTDLRAHIYLPLADHGILIAGSAEKASFDSQDLAFTELLTGDLVAALDRIDRE